MQTRVEKALHARLPDPENHEPQRLFEAMRYATLNGGKRIRALLVYAGQSADEDNGQREGLDAAAAAVEMIHAYSLVHDDLPCMDDDDWRRGKPSCHRRYDEATALLVGDALQAQAFGCLAQSPLPAATVLAQITLLAQAVGAQGMVGGQALDLAAQDRHLGVAELEMMHLRKTGALIRASVLLGASCVPASLGLPEASLRRYADCVGLLFQIVDDLLDDSVSRATLGKTQGKDARSGKATYVTVLGPSQAQQQAQTLHAHALAALDSSGAGVARLRALADYIMVRDR